jgi:hypothetical protein
MATTTGKWNFKTAASESTTDFEPVNEGRYPLTIEDATISTASTGTTMLNITMVINGDTAFKNRKVWKSFALDKPKAMRFVIEFLKSSGSKLFEKDDVDNDALIADLRKDRRVSAWLTPGTTTNGNPTTNATKFLGAKEAAKADVGSDLFQ